MSSFERWKDEEKLNSMVEEEQNNVLPDIRKHNDYNSKYENEYEENNFEGVSLELAELGYDEDYFEDMNE